MFVNQFRKLIDDVEFFLNVLAVVPFAGRRGLGTIRASIFWSAMVKLPSLHDAHEAIQEISNRLNKLMSSFCLHLIGLLMYLGVELAIRPSSR